MSLFNAYVTLSGAIDADVLRDESLSRRTTYRIGGPCAMTCICHTLKSLTRCLEVLESEGVEWVIMGKGSNILASDEGFDGCAILLGREFSRIEQSDDGHVTVGSAVMLPKLVNHALSKSLAGLEFACGIPGTVGGAIAMDAGTRHDWIGRRVSCVVVLRPGEGMHRYEGSDIDWGYRRTSIPPNEIILETTLALEPGNKRKIAADMDLLLSRRRRSQPMGKPSCGSVFKNPPDASVGQIIEECGLKGREHGGAQISETHGNFIVNNGNATARDVLYLMRLVHDTVLDDRGIDLVPEVKFLGIA